MQLKGDTSLLWFHSLNLFTKYFCSMCSTVSSGQFPIGLYDNTHLRPGICIPQSHQICSSVVSITWQKIKNLPNSVSKGAIGVKVTSYLNVFSAMIFWDWLNWEPSYHFPIWEFLPLPLLPSSSLHTCLQCASISVKRKQSKHYPKLWDFLVTNEI